MRLTNQMREDFVNAVMRKVRRRQKWDRVACAEEINKRLESVLADDIKVFAADHPNLLVRSSLCLAFLTYRDTNNCRRYYYAQCVAGQELRDIDIEDLKKNHERWVKEEERRKEMAIRLRQVADSVTTNTALAEALPDLVRFVPVDEPQIKKMLPVARRGLFDDLKALGLEVEE